MTSDDLERIFRENCGASFQDGLRAVYTHGYYDGAGTTISAGLPDRTPVKASPSVVVKLPYKGKG